MDAELCGAPRRLAGSYLTGRDLVFYKIDRNGNKMMLSLNPYWARVENREISGGISRLVVSSGGRIVEVGSFLSAHEKSSLFEDLKKYIHLVSEMDPLRE